MDSKYCLQQIHQECGWHEDAMLNGSKCGCFYCISIYSPSDIIDWVDELENYPRGPGRSAICPKCGIDSVLPESDHYEITTELLTAMNKEYF